MSFEDIIDIKFKNKELLNKALTHSSISKDSNERLEFLGDAVLEFIISKKLYLSCNFDEGVLTNKRSQFVCTDALASAARKLSLDKFIFFEGNEVLTESVLAGCFEALIGAIYLDQGIRKVEIFIKNTILLANHKVERNWKGILQEYTVKHMGLYPNYVLITEIGPPHKRRFQVEVQLGDKIWGTGSGKSIQSAEKKAAKVAFKKYCKKRDN